MRLSSALALLALLLLPALAPAQKVALRGGLRLGIATSDVATDEVRFSNGGDEFGVALADARYALQGGLFAQLKLGKVVVQPEVLFVSTRNDYLLRDLSSPAVIETIRSENFQHLDIPVLAGFKWGPLRLQAGPVGTLFLSESSDFAGVADYAGDFEKWSFGYQAGVGLDLWNVLIDFKYQGGFSDVGSHLTFGGRRIAFDTNPSQLVIGVGLSFN